MIKTHSVLLMVFFPLTLILPQDVLLHPTEVNYPIYMDKSPALSSMKMITPMQENEAWENDEIPNHVRPNLNKKIIKDENFRDPVVQDKSGLKQTTGIIKSFAGMSNSCSCYPPDPNIDVGPNHIIQTVNTQFKIWNKNGSTLYGPANLSTIWQDFTPGPWTGTNNGDPIVLYDQLADRWLISQFSLPTYPDGPFYELIAISSTPNPLGTYNRYVYQFSYMRDYPKIGVWSDGYYMSSNDFASGTKAWIGTSVSVMERDAMLAGTTARIITFTTGTSNIAWSWLPSDADGMMEPPAGTPNYFMMEVDGAKWDGGADRLRSRALHADWNNTANSTFGAPVDITVAAFDESLCNYDISCIPQYGTSVGLDALSDRLMHRLQYRNFGGYQTIVCNHTVDVGSNHAGIRWYELRNYGSGWYVYQQGTYAPDATHRWMGSIAMDGDGNVALGYSTSSPVQYPSIEYTGRYKSDALGSFSLVEQPIIFGGGSQTGTGSRWGDYSMMTVDPSDDATFWYTNECMSTTSEKSWITRIASFQISSLALTSPIGGEFWTNGSVHDITWSASGVSNIKLEFTTDNGTNWHNINANIAGATGSYTWTIREISSDMVKVRITDRSNSSLKSQSTDYFSVSDSISTVSPSIGTSSSTTFATTGITFTGNVTVSAPVTVNYYSKNRGTGTIPDGIKYVSPYFWVITNSGTTFTNGKIVIHSVYPYGVSKFTSLRWLMRSNKGDPWTDIGSVFALHNTRLESSVPFSSFGEFALGSTDSSNYVPIATITALIQGRYNGSTMEPDTVTIELRNYNSPYTLVGSRTGILNSAGVGKFSFPTAYNNLAFENMGYYIVIKHRNSIETWGKDYWGFFEFVLNCDMTSSQSMAYGSNLVQTGTKWCIYSGDVNQDGLVNLPDLIAMDNDNANYLSGYVSTDLTGDGIVDLSDLIIAENNSANYVIKVVPTGAIMSDKNKQKLINEDKLNPNTVK